MLSSLQNSWQRCAYKMRKNVTMLRKNYDLASTRNSAQVSLTVQIKIAYFVNFEVSWTVLAHRTYIRAEAAIL